MNLDLVHSPVILSILTPVAMLSTIKTTRPKSVPAGYRRFKYCTRKYKRGILGKQIESEMPIWAERRVDPNPVFSQDKVYYVLYTFVNY